MSRIDLLVPVLARPQNVDPLLASLAASTDDPPAVLFLTTRGDVAEIRACRSASRRFPALSIRVSNADYGGRSEYPRKMNRGLRETSAEFLLMGADDLDFRPGWDAVALAVADATGVGVVGTNDLGNRNVMRGRFSTHALVRRSYVEEVGAALDGPGVLCHEGYDHNYTDVELCKLAQARGEWAFAAKSHVVHRHPQWRTAEHDSTYEKGERHWRRDAQLYRRREREWK